MLIHVFYLNFQATNMKQLTANGKLARYETNWWILDNDSNYNVFYNS